MGALRLGGMLSIKFKEIESTESLIRDKQVIFNSGAIWQTGGLPAFLPAFLPPLPCLSVASGNIEERAKERYGASVTNLGALVPYKRSARL